MEDKLLQKDLEGEQLTSGEENPANQPNVQGETVNVGLEAEPTIPTEPAETSTEGSDETVSDTVVEEPTVEAGEPPIIEEDGAIETSYKTFTQDDVDKLVGETRVKTREKTFNYIYNRYGVKNEEELDSLVANAQRYDTLKEETDNERAGWETERNERDGKLTSMSEEIALMKSGVDSNRYEDVKLILKGKGLEVTTENIEAELATHPEWISKEEKEEEAVAPTPINPEEPAPTPTVTTRIKALGNEPKPAPSMSEEEQAEKLFKMKFHN